MPGPGSLGDVPRASTPRGAETSGEGWQRPAAPAGRAASTPAGRRRASRVRHSAPRGRQIPYVIIICGLAGALVWMRQSGQNARGGTLAVAGIVLAAALARLMLPESRAGMLVTRSRLADVVILAALGAGVLAAGLVLPAQA